MSEHFRRHLRKKELTLKVLWFMTSIALFGLLASVILSSESLLEFGEIGIQEIILISIATSSALIAVGLRTAVFSKNSLVKALTREDEVGAEKSRNATTQEELTPMEQKLLSHINDRFAVYLIIFILQLFLHLEITCIGLAAFFIHPVRSIAIFLPFIFVSFALHISAYPNMGKILDRAKKLF